MEIHNPSVTGSLLLSGSLTSTGNITTLGTLIAQTLIVQDVTSSRDFVTGSTKFGSLLTNNHQFTGSVDITGSLILNGNPNGFQGTQGRQGPQGIQGSQGNQGPIGPQGNQGPTGLQGTTGAQGNQGPQGIQGITGAQGNQGPIGPQGNQGPIGPQGFQGVQGIQGFQGVQGFQGNQGPIGPQGLQGNTLPVNNNVNNRVITATGGSSVEAESNLTFDGSTLTITGTLVATTKSFSIDHPTKKGKKLVYGVLEGPEHSVFVRGRLINENVIILPDYWYELIDENTITLNLTPIGKQQLLYVKEVTSTHIIIDGDNEIDCYYVVFAERKDVDKLETELDK
jgi:hypothetical protein